MPARQFPAQMGGSSMSGDTCAKHNYFCHEKMI